MVLPLASALVIAAVLSSAVLMLEREGRWSPYVALGAAIIQALFLFGIIGSASGIWSLSFMLPAIQFIAAYTVWSDTKNKRLITASTVLLSVTMIELAMLLGRVR